MILYIENPKDSTEKLLKLIHECSKVAGCKTNIQKSVSFLNTNNKLSKEKLRKQPHIKLHQKEMATHSSVLAWRIPGTGDPGGLLSMGSHRVGHN